MNKTLENIIKTVKDVGYELLGSWFLIGSSLAVLGYNIWQLNERHDFSFEQNLEYFKKEYLSLEFLISSLKDLSAFSTIFYLFIQLENEKRKRKGKKPVKLLKFLGVIPYAFIESKKERFVYGQVDALPYQSLSHLVVGEFEFERGNFFAGLQGYERAVKLIRNNFLFKVPFYQGSTRIIMINVRSKEIIAEAKEKDHPDYLTRARLAAGHLFFNEQEKVLEQLEGIDFSESPIGLRVLVSRFYDVLAREADKPRIRTFSCGISRLGMCIDRLVYFWDKQPFTADELKSKAEDCAMDVLLEALSSKGITRNFERVGNHEVYRISLDELIRGFLILKKGDLEKLEKEKETEEIFFDRVAGGRIRSVRPLRILNHKGAHYLVQYHEDGAPLSECEDISIYKTAVRLVATSDSLMPAKDDEDYSPYPHFESRIKGSGLDQTTVDRILINCDCLFRYAEAFPQVFDGDWHPDNCLYDIDGNIIVLDKEPKASTIGPVNLARILNQGTKFGFPNDTRKQNRLKDGLIVYYTRTYNHLVRKERRIREPDLVLPSTLAATIEKAMTAYSFTIDKPLRHSSTLIFLGNAHDAAVRIAEDPEMQRFYSSAERRKYLELSDIIKDCLIPNLIP